VLVNDSATIGYVRVDWAFPLSIFLSGSCGGHMIKYGWLFPLKFK
jgi:hypothetical protein